MNTVFEKTRELAEALMNSEEYRNMKAAEDKAMANGDAAGLMGRYLELKQCLETILHSDKADPEKIAQIGAEMENLQSQFQQIDDIANMNLARTAFDNLINQVNQVLQFIITGRTDTPDDLNGCTHSCETCPGCQSKV